MIHPTNNAYPNGKQIPVKQRHEGANAVTREALLIASMGTMNRQEAEQILHGRCSGAYLIRYSPDKNDYVVSIIKNKKFEHYTYLRAEPQIMANKYFEKLIDPVRYYCDQLSRKKTNPSLDNETLEEIVLRATIEQQPGKAVKVKANGKKYITTMNHGKMRIIRRKREILGSGGEGDVYAAKNIISGKVNIALKKACDLDDEFLDCFHNAQKNLAFIHKDGPVNGVEPQIKEVTTVMRDKIPRSHISLQHRFTGGTMQKTAVNEIMMPSKIKREDILNVLRQYEIVFGGLAHCHAKKIAHLDCKEANIWLDANGQPFLGDWSGAFNHNDFERESYAYAFTRDHCIAKDIEDFGKALCLRDAAEDRGDKEAQSLQEQNMLEIAKKSDVFGMGVSLYVSLVGFNPFNSEDGIYPDTSQGWEFTRLAAQLDSMSPDQKDKLHALIDQMLEPDRNKRISMEDAHRDLVDLLT